MSGQARRAGGLHWRAASCFLIPGFVPAHDHLLAALGARDLALQMRQHGLQVGQQGQVGPGQWQLIQVDRRMHKRFAPERPAHPHVAVRPHHERATGEALAALETDQLRQHAEDAMFIADPPQQVLPMCDVVGSRAVDAACRRGADHIHHLRTVQRRYHPADPMPGVLADQYGYPPVARVERSDMVPCFYKARFVEDAVGRQEEFAVNVPDPQTMADRLPAQGRWPGGGAEGRVERAVVVAVAVALVEADHNI